MNRFLLASFFILSLGFLKAQDLNISVGTEFPVQHFIGINYQHNEKFSGSFSFGRVDSPYNDELYDWISVPDNLKAQIDFLQLTTDDGSVIEIGSNYHYQKWYGGLYLQRIRLNASGNYREIINSDLIQEDLNAGERREINEFLNSPLALFVNFEEKVELETTLIQLGLRVGRQFYFKNPKLSMLVELGLSKNMSSKSEGFYDEQLLQRVIGLEQQILGTQGRLEEGLNIENRLDDIDDMFNDYGYIPSLTIGISYKIHSWKEKSIDVE